MSGLSPECASMRTSANVYRFMNSRPSQSAVSAVSFELDRRAAPCFVGGIFSHTLGMRAPRPGFAGDKAFEFPLCPRGRAPRRHHQRHCRHRLVDHADAGSGLSIRAEAGRADYGDRRRDGEPVPHPRLVARGRLARLRRLFASRYSGRGPRRAHAAGAAVARGRYFDRPVPDRDGAGAALARPA